MLLSSHNTVLAQTALSAVRCGMNFRADIASLSERNTELADQQSSQKKRNYAHARSAVNAFRVKYPASTGIKALKIQDLKQSPLKFPSSVSDAFELSLPSTISHEVPHRGFLMHLLDLQIFTGLRYVLTYSSASCSGCARYDSFENTLSIPFEDFINPFKRNARGKSNGVFREIHNLLSHLNWTHEKHGGLSGFVKAAHNYDLEHTDLPSGYSSGFSLSNVSAYAHFPKMPLSDGAHSEEQSFFYEANEAVLRNFIQKLTSDLLSSLELRFYKGDSYLVLQSPNDQSFFPGTFDLELSLILDPQLALSLSENSPLNLETKLSISNTEKRVTLKEYLETRLKALLASNNIYQ